MAGLALWAVALTAHADVTGWTAVRSGYGVDNLTGTESAGATLQMDAGAGTSPHAPLLVGALFRVTSQIGTGTRLAFPVRVATRGFQMEPWGAALDVGPGFRTWDTVTVSGEAALVGSGPLGLELALRGTLDGDERIGGAVLLGVDLAKLTVYRTSLGSQYPNPMPPTPRDDYGLR